MPGSDDRNISENAFLTRYTFIFFSKMIYKLFMFPLNIRYHTQITSTLHRGK